MKTDWTRLALRRRDMTDKERIAYIVNFLAHSRGSEKTKQRAINELRKLRR